MDTDEEEQQQAIFLHPPSSVSICVPIGG